MFDVDFLAKYTKPFTVLNYVQKLLNELENSVHTINDAILVIVLKEAASYANHYRSEDGNDVFHNTLAYYIDPRIIVGFCIRNGLDYNVYYNATRVKMIGSWLNTWINTINKGVVKNFRYHQSSIFLNYKTIE